MGSRDGPPTRPRKWSSNNHRFGEAADAPSASSRGRPLNSPDRSPHRAYRPTPRAPVPPSPSKVQKSRPVLVPRHAIHPRCGLRPKREVRRPQAIDVDMMQERREPRFLIRCCHSAHATKLTERALPGTGSGTRFASRVPLGRSPSLHRLRHPALGVVRRFRRYYGTVRLLTIVHHGITALTFPARPAHSITTGG